MTSQDASRIRSAWVSQRLALLKLTPELKEELATGALTVEDGRRLGKLPQPQQAAAAEEVKAERVRREPKDKPSGGNGVNTRQGRRGKSGNGVSTHQAEATPDWASPHSLAEFLKQRLSREHIRTLIALLTEPGE